MHAIRLHEFGPAENLRYDTVAAPVPAAGQVRIAVAAAGVHVVDTSIRAGRTGGPFPPPELPTIPGREVAGTIDELGAGVDATWLGRRVVAHLGQASGGYAELAVAAVDSLHRLPAEVSEDEAVAMIGTGRTTMAILEVAELTAKDVVVVLAAAGGIGALLVQAARNVGATVVGAAGSAGKLDQVRRLGATVAVDYSEPDWTDQVRAQLAGREPTVVLEGVGGELGTASLDLLGFGGRIIMYGYAAGKPTTITSETLFARSLTASVGIGPRLIRRPGGFRDLEERALAAVAARELVPLVGDAFPLDAAADAHAAIERRATTGKVILVP